MEAIHDRIDSQRQRVNEIRNDVHNKMQLLQLEKDIYKDCYYIELFNI